MAVAQAFGGLTANARTRSGLAGTQNVQQSASKQRGLLVVSMCGGHHGQPHSHSHSHAARAQVSSPAQTSKWSQSEELLDLVPAKEVSFASGLVTNETLQSWLERSAPEIVRHVHEAPLFHLIFDRDDEGRGLVMTQEKIEEDAVHDPDSWSALKGPILDSNPDGVILVHKLEEDDLHRRYGRETEGVLNSEFADRYSSRASCEGSGIWGLVVLGRSSRRHACYILRTTKVASTGGFATHYSLTKAKCFGPSLHQQLENAWVV